MARMTVVRLGVPHKKKRVAFLYIFGQIRKRKELKKKHIPSIHPIVLLQSSIRPGPTCICEDPNHRRPSSSQLQSDIQLRMKACHELNSIVLIHHVDKLAAGVALEI